MAKFPEFAILVPFGARHQFAKGHHMKRTGAVTLKGNPVDLKGRTLKVGDEAPDFKLQDNALGDVTLASSAGKTRIIATVPSLDTSVCAMETKKFNDEA